MVSHSLGHLVQSRGNVGTCTHFIEELAICMLPNYLKGPRVILASFLKALERLCSRVSGSKLEGLQAQVVVLVSAVG
jgi:hypothetical protein